MKLHHAAVSLTVVIGSATLWAGCNSDVPLSAGEEQNAASACKVFSVPDNRNLTPLDLANLNDPVAKRVLLGGCPQQHRRCPLVDPERSRLSGLADLDASRVGHLGAPRQARRIPWDPHPRLHWRHPSRSTTCLTRTEVGATCTLK